MKRIQPLTTLVIEDSPEDYDTLQWVVDRLCLPDFLVQAETSQEAFQYLESAPMNDGKLPALILLDLNLPGQDGLSVLKRLKANATFKAIPVVILTTSTNTKDSLACYSAGASSYLSKPIDLNRFYDQMKTLFEYWFETSTLPMISR